MTGPLDRCPDCGRFKARSTDDARVGMCPKWHAVRDPDAREDCESIKRFVDARRLRTPVTGQTPESDAFGRQLVPDVIHELSRSNPAAYEAVARCFREAVYFARGMESGRNDLAKKFVDMKAFADAREADAERWRSLVSVRWVRLLGYARHGPKGQDGKIRHIGFEFTTDGPRREGHDESVATLIEFVDGERAA